MEPNVLNENTDLQTEQPGVWKTAMTYGLYYALISIVLTVIFYATGNLTGKVSQYLGIVLLVVAIVLFQIYYRKALGGWMSYGQALGIAVASAFFASLITAVFTFVLYKFIDPGLIDQIRLATEEQLVQRGMPDEQIDAALAVSGKFQTPGIIAVMSVFSLTFMGLIIGAIAAIFTKKQSPTKIFD
ncbi:MAG: DUF4199 domain-containing protein [Bacteroidota bacterium]